MSERLKSVLKEALLLAPGEQVELAELLLQYEGETSGQDAAFIAEIERRWTQFAGGGAETYDAFETIEEARALLARKRGA